MTNASRITIEALKQIGIGLAITIVFTGGLALAGFANADSATTWLRNLELAETAAVGSYVVNALRAYLPLTNGRS